MAPFIMTTRVMCQHIYIGCTPDWKPEWGGEFIVYDENREAKTATSFKEDRLIIFNGSLPHRAVAPIRLSSLLRVTIAHQCKECSIK